eukprot:NODE_1179_length_1218_cov_2.599312.p2 GENE.NODE_1179_length_1218_cov_2.599312~~NODE_1179_length_1218_cov_2.599312.p2  ORF type:complete len:165 (+),score=29.38 NODE_1179_length_1218_cov_2.599312:231-725(+)
MAYYIIIPAMLIDALVAACPPERLHDMKFAAIQRIRLDFFNPMDANDYLHVQEKGFEVLGFGAVWVLNCSDLTVDVLSAAEKETGGPVFVFPLVPAPVASSPVPSAQGCAGSNHVLPPTAFLCLRCWHGDAGRHGARLCQRGCGVTLCKSASGSFRSTVSPRRH